MIRGGGSDQIYCDTTSLSAEGTTSLDAFMSTPDLPRPATALNYFVSTLRLERHPFAHR